MQQDQLHDADDCSPRPDFTPYGEAEWSVQLREMTPSLRAFAWSLSRNGADADDLVQETLIKAWTNRQRFQPGTLLRAWLFTIMRNHWYSTVAKRRREVADVDGRHAGRVIDEARQEWTMEVRDLHAALDRLPATYREALVLVAAAGLSYEEAAEIADVPLGTIKSRVSRGRTLLAAILDGEALPEGG